MRKTLSDKQRQWLEHLRDNGPSENRSRGKTAWSCRIAGWSEWMVKDKATGEVMPRSAAEARLEPGEVPFEKYPFVGGLETITEAGRAALSQKE